jgi:hypothetical protein
MTPVRIIGWSVAALCVSVGISALVFAAAFVLAIVHAAMRI